MVDPKLENWRNKIDVIDLELLMKLAERKRISSQVMQWKEKNNQPLFDQERETKMLQLLSKKASSLSLSKDLVEKLYQLILEDAKKL